MRFDTAGLFWDDTPPPRILKPQPPKRSPPPRTWEEPGYLPYLDEARRFPVSLFTWEELDAAKEAREILLCDTEVYPNYFLVGFTSVATGKVAYFETTGEGFDPLTRSRLKWILENFIIVTFNGNFFDIPMLSLAVEGLDTFALKKASNQIIGEGLKPWMVLRSLKVKALRLDHIDLIEVAPLSASLKIYGGRLHVPRMQELPFQHNTILSEDQISIVRWYCIGSDLTATAFLFLELAPQIQLRAQMSTTYGTDLRSKSDAQIAEAVINAEYTRLTYAKPSRPQVVEGQSFQYKTPAYISYESEVLNAALATVQAAHFVIGENGAPEMPEEIKALKIEFGGRTFQMGIGGLHSVDECAAYYADEDFVLMDRDVTSYYPSIILNQELYPEHLGTGFLDVYRTLVNRRKQAKKDKNKVEADTIKIVVNGAFGKLGSKWSTLYAPDLMIQVTITGQLTLLMLIERLYAFGCGAEICSANTDGVLFRFHKDKAEYVAAVVKQWELETGFETEDTLYQAVFARDVNNYIAVKQGGGAKVKGAYSERGSAGDSVLSKNPESLICADAVVKFLTEGVSVSETIYNCRDIRRFVSVRTVKGGAVKDGEYLGKAIRWYYSTEIKGEIIYAETGNKVPKSDNARPCMELPEIFPADLDFEHYKRVALEMLREIGYPMPEAEQAA